MSARTWRIRGSGGGGAERGKQAQGGAGRRISLAAGSSRTRAHYFVRGVRDWAGSMLSFVYRRSTGQHILYTPCVLHCTYCRWLGSREPLYCMIETQHPPIIAAASTRLGLIPRRHPCPETIALEDDSEEEGEEEEEENEEQPAIGFLVPLLHPGCRYRARRYRVPKASSACRTAFTNSVASQTPHLRTEVQ